MTVAPRMCRNYAFCSLFGLLLAIGISASYAQDQLPPELPTADAQLQRQLVKILDIQATAWNEGDIERFMQAYWNSPQLTFSSGGRVERGWLATRDRYRTRYPDRKTMGNLTFSELEVLRLGASSAMVLGKWRLDRDEPLQGNFTLVWRKFESGWLIVHDHTSTLAD